jgi:SCY1-like protein 2
MSVKLESLRSFKVMIAKELDKYTLTEKLLPILYKMKTRESHIIMAALDVYSSLVTVVDVEVLATSVIPQILSLSMETSLAISQFEALFGSVRTMLKRVEDDRRKRLANNVAEPVQAVVPLQTHH